MAAAKKTVRQAQVKQKKKVTTHKCVNCGMVCKSKGGLTNHTKACKAKTRVAPKKTTKKKVVAKKKKVATPTVKQELKPEIKEEATQMTKLIDHIGAAPKKSGMNIAKFAEVYLLLVIITVIVGSGSFMAILVQGSVA